jgi:hypothetical protein
MKAGLMSVKSKHEPVRGRTYWLSNSDSDALKEKAREYFSDHKGYVEMFLRKIARAKGILFFEGKPGEVIEVRTVEK